MKRSSDDARKTSAGTGADDAAASPLLRLGLAGLSATAAQTVCQPIETVKIRLQLRVDSLGTRSPYHGYQGIWSGAKLIVRREGVAGLWKGMAPSALREMSYSSLRYGLFLPISSALAGGERTGTGTGTGTGPTPMWKRFLAGGLSGGIGAAIANPTDLLKARMQADTAIVAAKRMSQHAAEIHAAGGLGGFWLGVGTTVSRAVVLGAANLGTYSTAKALISEQGVEEGVPLHFCAASIAGLAIALSTAPIDLARSRLMVQTTPLTLPPLPPQPQQQQQQQGNNSPRHYRNGLEVIRDVVRCEGPMALYKGFWLQWARCAPYTVLQFVVWEQLCRAAGVRAV